MQLHLRPAVPVVDGDTDLDAADDAALRRNAHAHARRNRRRRQSIDRRLRADHGREQRAAAAGGIVRDSPTQTGGSTFTATWSDPTGQLAPITGALYQVCPASGSGSCSAPALGARGRAGDRDGSRPWKLEHRRVADQRGGQREPRQRRAHQRRRPAVKLRRLAQATARQRRRRSTSRETLRGRELVVHVSGPASGKVRVGFTGRLRGRTVASGAKTVALKHGRLTVDVQARSPHGGARADPRQREARSRARGDEHAPSQDIASCGAEAVVMLEARPLRTGTLAREHRLADSGCQGGSGNACDRATDARRGFRWSSGADEFAWRERDEATCALG